MEHLAPSIPAKVTDKRWADKLMEGSLFMRSLHDFGPWSIADASGGGSGMKQGVQIDISEGVVKTVGPEIGDPFFNALEPDLRRVLKKRFYIAPHMQYYKVFCMYGLTYLPWENRLLDPDERMLEFGDTAVVITDPAEFGLRVQAALWRRFGENYSFAAKGVRYYPPSYFGRLDEFCKEEAFSWQNELRMRVVLFEDEPDLVRRLSGQRKVVEDVGPLTLEIGDISDIAVELPSEDLVGNRDSQLGLLRHLAM